MGNAIDHVRELAAEDPFAGEKVHARRRADAANGRHGRRERGRSEDPRQHDGAHPERERVEPDIRRVLPDDRPVGLAERHVPVARKVVGDGDRPADGVRSERRERVEQRERDREIDDHADAADAEKRDEPAEPALAEAVDDAHAGLTPCWRSCPCAANRATTATGTNQ